MTPLAKAVRHSLTYDPDRWEEDEFCLTHENGVKVWVANGFWFLKVDRPEEIKFGAVGKVAVWLAVLRWRRGNKDRAAVKHERCIKLLGQGDRP